MTSSDTLHPVQAFIVEHPTDHVAAGIGRLMPYLDASFSGDPTPIDRLEKMIYRDHLAQVIAVRPHDIWTPPTSKSTESGLEIVQTDFEDDEFDVVGALSLSEGTGAGRGDYGQLEDVVVDPAIRRQGVAKKMLTVMRHWGEDRGFPTIQWESEEHRSHDSWPLYESIGAVRSPDAVHFELHLQQPPEAA